jgi:hypothetical protein
VVKDAAKLGRSGKDATKPGEVVKDATKPEKELTRTETEMTNAEL